MKIEIELNIGLSAAVMALLASASGGTLAKVATAAPKPSEPAPAAAAGEVVGVAGDEIIADEGAVDAGGHPWSAALHASTRGVTKDGFWRMKVGVSRPDNLPGFPKDGAAASGTGAAASSTAAAAPAASQTVADDDDEFAAFRAAADKTAAEDAAAKASVAPRKWTDADLGSLCNQAAVKLGDPAPVKAIIATFIPEGETPHSRNIPEAKRAEFAAAIEAKAGIEFAG